jgi:hypothetical protein
MIIMRRKLNAWNWTATTEVFCNGYADLLTTFNTEQYWDGSRAGHERLMKALIEHLEGQADRLNLEYRVHQPEVILGHKWAAKLPMIIEVDRTPF